MDFDRSLEVRAFWKAKQNVFEVIKWVYNKTFVEIMKNSRLNKSDVKIGEDERFLIVTFIFQTILNLVVLHLPYCGGEHHK